MNFTFVRSVLLAGAFLLPVVAHAADSETPPAPGGSPAPVAPAPPSSAPPSSAPPSSATVSSAPASPVPLSPATVAAPAGAAPQATTAPQPEPATLQAPPPVTQVVANPYGLDSLWNQGDFIARGTLLALVVMSAASWYVLVTKTWEQSTLLFQARRANRRFWTANSVEAGVTTLRPGSAFHVVATAGVSAAGSHGGSLVENIDLNTWISQSIQRAVDQIVNRLQGGLAVLATVGSTAPFVGLFGTVWGIYHALTAIGIAGQASIDKVAGPVGEALIMTAIGLAVAVPAVLGYNWLVRRNKVAVELVRNFGSDLHSVLIGGVKLNVAARAPGGKPLAQAA